MIVLASFPSSARYRFPAEVINQAVALLLLPAQLANGGGNTGFPWHRGQPHEIAAVGPQVRAGFYQPDPTLVAAGRRRMAPGRDVLKINDVTHWLWRLPLGQIVLRLGDAAQGSFWTFEAGSDGRDFVVRPASLGERGRGEPALTREAAGALIFLSVLASRGHQRHALCRFLRLRTQHPQDPRLPQGALVASPHQLHSDNGSTGPPPYLTPGGLKGVV